ncbi:TIM barrel protein [Phragmitibacter flavus]|uniref:TIM barrel protein n=1 Tax=Phragmitibacter flavus TaxID=2576071 RepID=A0A5R8KHD1_9BACT|nr:TIM barrel protein [Phragmitibacter flavus]TLD71650.1 TIM barrel protein [Phragmitibacter flavus]
MNSSPLSRRRLLQSSAFAAVATSLHHRLSAADVAAGSELKGRINHSVCKWCYSKIPLDDLCTAGKAMGLSSVELVDPPDFPTLKKHGLTAAMVSFPTIAGPSDPKVGRIENAFNDPANHDLLIQAYEPLIKASAEFGAKQVICFSGNRNGMDDEVGLKNCAEGLKKLLPIAEKHKITLVMELLNSRVNHKDYMCDKSAWGVALCKEIGSENFKLLFDIYHMQIMEGDIIATIKRDHQYFAHYHTGGVPGRAEIDETQELHYPAIMRAIVETGYKGHVGQEFIPKREDKLASLKQGVQICDV